MNGYKHTNLADGINLYYIPTDKFKTSTVTINIHQQLNKEKATFNALLPRVLARGTSKLQSFQDISRYLQELYGTVFSYGVKKMGEDHIIHFYFDIIDDRYVNESESLFKCVMEFAKQVIFEPLIENNGFKKEYVEQEKQNLKNSIQGLINDKADYAVERCYQEMCKNENFGIYELGRIEDIEKINEKNLYEHYLEVIHSSPIDIFVIGSVPENMARETVHRLFGIQSDKKRVYPSTDIITNVGQVKKVEEPMEVTQGKLSLGFRTKIPAKDKRYYSLIVFNSILGGGPHSKLFNNVREKLSLAYYVFSRLERFKGLMIISSGIEVTNYQKALDEILAQMDEMKKGNISEAELNAAISSSVNNIRSLTDSAYYIADYYLGQLVGNTEDDFEDIIKKISAVTKEDVVAISQNIELDTIYFLKNKD